MATQVVTSSQTASNPGASTEADAAVLTGPGASYANAVLKLKHTDSNKENISDTVRSTAKEHRPGKNSLKDAKERTRNQSNEENSAQDDGENFTTVTSHGRKERKNEKNKREKNPPQKAVIVNGAAPSQHREAPATAPNNKEKEPGPPHEKDNKESDPTANEKKVFIEAPLPKVNPWQVNKNAAQVVGGQGQHPPHVAVAPKHQDKRVLQPQRQEVNMSGA